MGKNGAFLKGTAETLRRIANEAEKNYDKAEAALIEADDREARMAERDKADLSARYPALKAR